MAQLAQGKVLPFFGQTRPLESGDQVVSQANELQVESVGDATGPSANGSCGGGFRERSCKPGLFNPDGVFAGDGREAGEGMQMG